MPVYLVDRDLPGITLDQIQAGQRRLIEAGQRLAERGRAVRYLRSVFVPSQGHLMDLFEAPDAAGVLELNRLAQFPALRVIEAIDLAAPAPVEEEPADRAAGRPGRAQT